MKKIAAFVILLCFLASCGPTAEERAMYEQKKAKDSLDRVTRRADSIASLQSMASPVIDTFTSDTSLLIQ